MVAIAEACAEGRLPAEISVVISDVPDAGILARARELGLRGLYLPPGRYRTKLDEEAEQSYVDTLRGARVDLVLLAGFMRILKSGLLRAFPQRVLNIHPALLPAFPGLEAWQQAFDYGVKVAGCTVHLVDEGVDTGPILVQRTVPVLDTDTPATLHARIQQQERIAYTQAVEAVLAGRIRLEGRRALGMTAA